MRTHLKPQVHRLHYSYYPLDPYCVAAMGIVALTLMLIEPILEVGGWREFNSYGTQKTRSLGVWAEARPNTTESGYAIQQA